MAKTAPEIIAFHFGCDWSDVKDGRYQGHVNPAVYVVSDDYYCCPTENQKLPRGFAWYPLSEYYGRTVYRSASSISRLTGE